MILRQFLHTEPVIAASYLVGCGGKGVAAVVDPVADPELATSAEDGARALFESACRLRALPDHVQLLPGAFSGSVCGRGLSGNPVSTMPADCVVPNDLAARLRVRRARPP